MVYLQDSKKVCTFAPAKQKGRLFLGLATEV